MACGCKKKTPVVTNQEQNQNVTIKLTESGQGSTTPQSQQDLVNKIVDKLNNLENDK
jgi:hypothetical protein